MHNNNEPKIESMMKNHSTKKLILCLVAVFVLFVAYKYISSGIQEDKEKAVIQERAYVQKEIDNQQQARTQQVDICVAKAEEKMNATIKDWKDNWTLKYCVNQPDIKAQTFCYQKAVDENEKAKAEAEVEMKDCYMRYK